MQYLLPGILTFVFGIVMWQLQKDRIRLDYEVLASAPFPRETGTGRYFIVRLRNFGNKQIENISLMIGFDAGPIESVSFSKPNLIKDISRDSLELRGSLPLLNPGEILAITVTTAGGLPAEPPSVQARATGVTARPRVDGPGPSNYVALVALATALLAIGYALAGIYNTSQRTTKLTESISSIGNLGELTKKMGTIEKDTEQRLKEVEQKLKEAEQAARDAEQGKPETPQNVFALMNRSGLAHRFPDLVTATPEITYWSTGVFLVDAFLTDESNRDKYVSAMQTLMDQPNMAPSSRGFDLYLLGKMEQFRGQNERATRWFDKCREQTPLMYEFMMTQDSAYDLKSVHEYLIHRHGK